MATGRILACCLLLGASALGGRRATAADSGTLYDVESPSARSLLTFAFLDALSLERQAQPSQLCTTLYHDMDLALDRLVDTPDWQHIAWQFSHSGIYDTLDALVEHGCDEDLGRDVAGENSECLGLRNRGRRQLYMLEHTGSAQAVIHSRAMHAWTAHLALGKQTGCLTLANDR